MIPDDMLEEVMLALQVVSLGWVHVIPLNDDSDGSDDHYFSVREYALGVTGWWIGVFDDAGGWDYLEWVRAPDGRRWEYAQMPDELRCWTPSADQLKTVWRW